MLLQTGEVKKVGLASYPPPFIKFKNKHSGIESNINELEHRGLDVVPIEDTLILNAISAQECMSENEENR
jgi:hypothetical protein